MPRNEIAKTNSNSNLALYHFQPPTPGTGAVWQSTIGLYELVFGSRLSEVSPFHVPPRLCFPIIFAKITTGPSAISLQLKIATQNFVKTAKYSLSIR